MIFRLAAFFVLLCHLGAAAASAQDLKAVPESKLEMQLSFAPLVKRIAGTVVNVYADKQVTRPTLYSDPFFEEFFGQRMPNRTEKQSSLGSGVIIDAKGLVITNNHVIAGADNVRIALADGREYAARVTFKDERLDLALLSLDGTKGDLEALSVGDSDTVEVGDLVLAVGNPFGVGQTVTSGIVSGLARSKIGEGDFSYFIQTDASINPGNSGGALINMTGELIGINTMIYSRDGGSNGIGFAIPANLLKVFIAAAQGGQPGFSRPYIGAS
uniref:trypsin-like peptidase domain-containing protein n=1 Tax=uncultured Rhizobium sp. TaxID=155567 RepID=UPI002605CADB